MDISEMDISFPLKPAILHILLALVAEDRHGYGIMQTVRDQSGGAVPLRTGSFYRHLSSLIDAGWVIESPGRPADDDPRRGAYYRLTDAGRDALATERRRLGALLSAFPDGTGTLAVPPKGTGREV
jgi:DNA-binding PadR family transcriptional regulator